MANLNLKGSTFFETPCIGLKCLWKPNFFHLWHKRPGWNFRLIIATSVFSWFRWLTYHQGCLTCLTTGRRLEWKSFSSTPGQNYSGKKVDVQKYVDLWIDHGQQPMTIESRYIESRYIYIYIHTYIIVFHRNCLGNVPLLSQLILSHPEALPWQVKLPGVRQSNIIKGPNLDGLGGKGITFKNCLDKMSNPNQIWSNILKFDQTFQNLICRIMI